MHKALQPGDDIDRLYMSRKEGGRGLTSIQGSVDVLIQQKDYKKVGKKTDYSYYKQYR